MAEENPLDSAVGAINSGAKKLLEWGVRAGLNLAAPGLGEIADKLRRIKSASKAAGEGDNSKKYLLFGGIGFFFLIVVVITVIIGAFVELKNVAISVISPSWQVLYANKVVDQPKTPNFTPGQTKPFTYAVTIGARSTNLTNLSIIKEEFTLIKNNGQIANVTSLITPSKSKEQLNDELKNIALVTGETTTFEFSIQLPGNIPISDLENSLLINTISIEGRILAGIDPKSVSATSTVIVGNFSGCFDFSGHWTADETALELKVIAKILSMGSKYVTALCGNPIAKINLIRENSDDSCRAPSNTSNILIRNHCLGSEENALYSLAHELGHTYTYRNSWVYPLFARQYLIPYICSYPETKSQAEDLPEAIAVYTMNLYYPSWKYHACKPPSEGKPINLQTDYPKHYNFVLNLFF